MIELTAWLNSRLKWWFGGAVCVLGSVGVLAGGLDARLIIFPYVAPHALTLAVWGVGYLAFYVKKFGNAAPLLLAFSWSLLEILFNSAYSLYSQSWTLMPNLLVAVAVFGILTPRIQWLKSWGERQWFAVGLIVLSLSLSPVAWYYGIDAFHSPIAEAIGDLPSLFLVVALAD